MLIAFYKIEGVKVSGTDVILCKIFTTKQHIQNWLNEYYSNRAIIFLDEDNFAYSHGQVGKNFSNMLSNNNMIIFEADAIVPSVTNSNYSYSLE